MINRTLPPVFAIQNSDGTYWSDNGSVTDVNAATLHRTADAAQARLSNAAKKVKQIKLDAKVVAIDSFITFVHIVG